VTTWDPTAREDEVYAATPLVRVEEPSTAVPSMNVTVPVAVEVVDAVRVSGFCSRIGFDEEVMVSVEVACATVKLVL
jgi:hypothetical protein